MVPEIVQLLSSPRSRYQGRPADGPLPLPDEDAELVQELRVRAGLGVVGDRYFGKPAHRDASVTIMARESLPLGFDLRQTRRNVLVAGFDIDACIGTTLRRSSPGSDDPGVVLTVLRAANPCAWMDVVIGPGAMQSLRGRGGVRCRPLSDGLLRLGPVRIELLDATAGPASSRSQAR